MSSAKIETFKDDKLGFVVYSEETEMPLEKKNAGKEGRKEIQHCR